MNRPPPRYYGWPMLTLVGFAQLVSWGVLYYGFSVFVPPERADLGWSLPAITGAFSVAILLSGAAAPLVGRWVDSHGPRVLMTIGSCGAVVLVLLWSRVTNLVAFYAIWAGIGLMMATVLYEPAFALLAQWFVRYRARALTLLTFIGGFASVVFIPLSAWLQREYGWRTALVILAATLAGVTIPVHALVVRRRPADLGLLADGDGDPMEGRGTSVTPRVGSVPRAVAIRSASFRWLVIGFGLVLFANAAVVTLLIPYLTDRGYGSAFAASAAGAIGIFSLPGRLIFTPLGERLPRRFVTALIFALQTVGILTLILVPTRAGVWGFVALFGAGFGALTPARASLIVDLYGPAHYASIAGIVTLFRTLAQGAAPLTAGLLYAAAGDYRPVFWLMAGVSALSVGAILFIERDIPASAVMTAP